MSKKNKRVVAVILAIVIVIGGVATSLSVFASNTDNKTDNDGLGYIIQMKDAPLTLMSVITNDNLDVIDDELKIYHTKDYEFIEKNKNLIDICAKDCYVDLYEYQETPNDTLYNKQWYINDTKIDVLNQKGLTGEGITVGVIDTGVNIQHEDLENANIQKGINVCSVFDKDEENYYNIEDTKGHGTQTVGIIAAERNNSMGIAGLMSDCSIIPYKIDKDGSEYSRTASAVLKAMQYANLQNCDVVNMSLGFSKPSDELLTITNNIVKQLNDSGIIVVAAVGNDGRKGNIVAYPAACSGVIGVGSCAKTNDIYSHAFYSTSNYTVDVVAPGTSILTTGSEGDYPYAVGTSVSAPIVTCGVVALKQKYPDLTNTDIEEILTETAIDLDDTGYDIGTGYGLIDCEAALNYADDKHLKPTPTPEPTPAPDYSCKLLNWEWSFKGTDTNDKIFRVTVQTENNTGTNKRADLLLGVYDDNGVLRGISKQNIQLPPSYANVYSLEVESGNIIKKMKVFLWDENSLYPLTDVIEFNNKKEMSQNVNWN